MKIIRLSIWISLLTICLTSCHVARFFYWNYAGLNDYKKFPEAKIEAAQPNFHFYPARVSLNKIEDPSFDEFLVKNKTAAFLIIRNDTILYERYFGDFSRESVIPSFSVAKVFVSALIGIAIDEGLIKSANDPITDYLPEFLKIDQNFGKIRIEDLLNMRSGIDFNEGYSTPFSEMAKYYYGTNLNKYLKNLKIKSEPDLEYDYISVNTQLLAEIIERTSKKPLNVYLEEKIWKPIGMEFGASWSMDSKKNRQVKSFCCINSRAIDFARFGKLYLDNGQWGNQQIIPVEWVKKSSGIVNDSKDSQGYSYTYQWRVLENGAIFAKGVLGQFIYIDKRKSIIMVRMGNGYGNIHWPVFFEELVKEL